MKKHFVALDMGSTFTKCALISSDGVIRETRKPSPQNTRTDGVRWEADAAAILRQAEELLREMRDGQTAGVLLSTQMHGYALTDRSGTPVGPYVSWQDGVGRQYLRELIDALGSEAARPSGVPMKANLALCALAGRLRGGEALPRDAQFHTLGGMLIRSLTGRHVCHMTNAAPTGMADVRQGGWNEELIQRSGLSSLAFPKIVSNFEPVGTWEGLDVYPDLGDQQACAFGANLSVESDLHVSVGTSGLMGALTRGWGAGAYENRPWVTPGVYLRTVSGLPGGRDADALAGYVRELASRALGQDVPLDPVRACLSETPMGQQESDTLWMALRRGPDAFTDYLYGLIGSDYRRAADALDLPLARVAFSGGCVRGNPAIRRRMLKALWNAPDLGDFDVMCGMTALAKVAE